MGRKRSVINTRKKEKKYNIVVRLDKERDKDLIEAIQKIPPRGRSSAIRSILYLYFILGVGKHDIRSAVETNTTKPSPQISPDVKAQIKSFMKIVKEGRNEQ